MQATSAWIRSNFMQNTDLIICKPTQWFISRAAMMLAMFTFLGGWFYKDAKTGYRQKNEVFLMERAFQQAAQTYDRVSKEPGFTENRWKEFAAKQVVDFGADRQLLPDHLPEQVSWPEELQQVELIKQGPAVPWNAFTARLKWDSNAPEKLHDQRSINEQWYFAIGMGVLAVVTLVVLLRTIRRQVRIDHEKIISQTGEVVYFHQLKQLDLRKWGNKGLAFGTYVTDRGVTRRLRFDGLTYGGFKKQEGEPAEAMMQRIREHFSGEILEYADESSASTEPGATAAPLATQAQPDPAAESAFFAAPSASSLSSAPLPVETNRSAPEPVQPDRSAN